MIGDRFMPVIVHGQPEHGGEFDAQLLFLGRGGVGRLKLGHAHAVSSLCCDRFSAATWRSR
jgi:hypothetical protein